jgi:protein phosphatase
MGGHGAGDVASQIAVRSIVARFNEDPEYPTGNFASAAKRLSKWIVYANHRVLEAAESGIGTQHMGTTGVVAWVGTSGEYCVGWVGDSRAYVLTDLGIKQITEDHAYAHKLLKEGLIKPEEVKTHPYRSVLLQSIGGGQSAVEPEICHGTLSSHSLLMLCSDGLTNELTDQEIHAIVRSKPTLNEAAHSLVEAANQHGGLDNITVLLLCRNPHFESEEKDQFPAEPNGENEEREEKSVAPRKKQKRVSEAAEDVKNDHLQKGAADE